MRRRFSPWVGTIPWRRKWQPTPSILAWKSHGWRSLVGSSPWGCKESDTTERLHFTYDFLEQNHVTCESRQFYFFLPFIWPGRTDVGSQVPDQGLSLSIGRTDFLPLDRQGNPYFFLSNLYSLYFFFLPAYTSHSLLENTEQRWRAQTYLLCSQASGEKAVTAPLLRQFLLFPAFSNQTAS